MRANKSRFWIVPAALLAAGCFPQHSRYSSVSEPPPSPLAKSVIRTAETYLTEGGASAPASKDCSDFVRRVFETNGVRLPRTAAAMSRLGARVRSARELRMGDLVFFSGERVGRKVGHVGIYVRNGAFIHLSRPEVGVSVESLYNDYYRRRYLTARRVLD